MKRSDRLRAIGWAILGSGVVGGGARYWIMSHDPDVALDDASALGYSRSMQHGMGVMMGKSGALLTDVWNVLASPGGQACVIAACAALFAGYFFRVAWIIDDDSR